MKALFTWVLIGLTSTLWLSGCQSFSASKPPPLDDVATSIGAGMDLVGKWEYRMHLDLGGQSLMSGKMVIQYETCSSSTCEIGGYLEIPESFRTREMPLLGHSYPQEKFIRFQYDDTEMQIIGGDLPVVVVVVLDLQPASPAPHRALAGYYITFSRRDWGYQWDDDAILRAADRGRVTTAGRVTAWPGP
jgi:hypothetical protein